MVSNTQSVLASKSQRGKVLSTRHPASHAPWRLLIKNTMQTVLADDVTYYDSRGLRTLSATACGMLWGMYAKCLFGRFWRWLLCLLCGAKPTAPAHEDTALASSPKSIAIRHFSSLQNKEPREYLESQGILMATTETSASSACHLHRKTCHLVILLRSSIQKLGRSYDCTLPVNNSIKPPSLGNSRKLFPMFSSPAFYSSGFIIEEK